MNYSFCVPYGENCRFKTYVAEIIGEDPKYRLQRKFLWRKIEYDDYGQWNDCELPDTGVFEIGVKRFDIDTDKLISHERTLLIALEGDYYEYRGEEFSYDDILLALFNLEAQTRADPAGNEDTSEQYEEECAYA